MSPRIDQPTKPCERCGIRVTVNYRPRPILVCRDCRHSDPEWLRLVRGTAVTQGISGGERGRIGAQQNGPGWRANASSSGASPLPITRKELP